MRIPSGVTDQYIYFVALDSADWTTRETGFSSWTVYRSRNGAAAAVMTGPTINETDNTNMPGVYELLLDEDMTIDAGDDSQEMVFHITHAGMAPVTRTIEIYRPKITAGQTVTAANGAAESDLTYIHGSALTETAGQLAAAFKKLFDVASPLLVASDVMVGTDNAALAATALTDATWTDAKAAFLNAAITGVPTTAEFEARTLDATSLARLKASVDAIVTGVVVADGTNTNTTFDTDLTTENENYYGDGDGGMVIAFIDGTANQGQARRIIASVTAGTETRITLEAALDAEPDTDDAFIVLGRITELS